jgi:hypothetical protein
MRRPTVCVLAAVVGLVALGACNRREPSPIAEPSEPPAKPILETASTPLLPCPVPHATLGPGLEVERWHLDAKPATSTSPPCVDVVRADAARFTLKILSPDDATNYNARDWLTRFHLSAVTNAGMFHESGEAVGMIVADGTARSNDNSKMSGYLAWDPVDASDPPITLAGRDCPGFDLAKLRARYHSIVQSYRLLGCDGGPLPWKDPKQYSAAAIGIDRARRIVFLHARAAVTMAELSIELASHDLVGALFLEGGPESSLVAKGSEGELAVVGSYETNFVENDGNTSFWELPNVIGLLPR